MATANTKNKQAGSILLVSYNDSEFTSLCKKNSGAFILDARQKGWSSNELLKSENLLKAFPERYKLIPGLVVIAGESPEEYLTKATPVITKIAEIVGNGGNAIITGFNTGLLKCLGHMIMCASPETKVFLKWETDEEAGISRQKPMSDEDFVARITRICERLESFQATDAKNADMEAFSIL